MRKKDHNLKLGKLEMKTIRCEEDFKKVLKQGEFAEVKGEVVSIFKEEKELQNGSTIYKTKVGIKTKDGSVVYMVSTAFLNSDGEVRMFGTGGLTKDIDLMEAYDEDSDKDSPFRFFGITVKGKEDTESSKIHPVDLGTTFEEKFAKGDIIFVKGKLLIDDQYNPHIAIEPSMVFFSEQGLTEEDSKYLTGTKKVLFAGFEDIEATMKDGTKKVLPHAILYSIPREDEMQKIEARVVPKLLALMKKNLKPFSTLDVKMAFVNKVIEDVVVEKEEVEDEWGDFAMEDVETPIVKEYESYVALTNLNPKSIEAKATTKKELEKAIKAVYGEEEAEEEEKEFYENDDDKITKDKGMMDEIEKDLSEEW